MQLGIVEVNLFTDRFIVTSDDRLQRDDGRLPVRRLPPTSRI